MPKVKNINGLNSLTNIKATPLSINRHHNSQTQPQTHRLLYEQQQDCCKKECLIMKWSLQQNQLSLLQLQRDVDKYQQLYVKERKKLGDTYKEIEEIMKILEKKEQNLRTKHSDYKENISKQRQQQIRNDEQAEQMQQLQLELEKRESSLQENIKQYKQEQIEQQVMQKELECLKSTLENSIQFLKSQEQEMIKRLQDLAVQEKEALKKIENLNIFAERSSEHQQSLLQIESLLKEKTDNLDNFQQSIIQKQEELQFYEQQLQLRSMCTSLNEGAFYKRVAAQTDRLYNQCKTPTEELSSKRSNFYKNNHHHTENIMISTINSRETSPYSKDSFRLFKRQTPLGSASQRINNPLMVGDINI